MRSSNLNKLFKKRREWILLTLILTVIHNEFFSFWQDSWTWPQLQCHHSIHNSSSCQKILIVADPQILSISNGIVSFVEAMDSDMYMKQSFQLAVKHVSPNVILFLGDLLDKGSQTAEEEYSSYKNRLDWVFDTGELKPLVISIPGDNDIGGEGNDRVTEEKVERFNRYFGSESQKSKNHVEFLKVNRITGDFNFPNTTFKEGKFRVVLSHISLSFFQGLFSEAVMEKLKPHLIFSAHDHRLAMATTQYKPFHISFQTSELDDIKHSLKIQKNLSSAECIEIVWPTCSYRMGVPNVGYGVVSIGTDGAMEAAVLWTHSRFKTLTIYLSVLIFCVVFYLYSSFRMNARIQHSAFIKPFRC